MSTGSPSEAGAGLAKDSQRKYALIAVCDGCILAVHARHGSHRRCIDDGSIKQHDRRLKIVDVQIMRCGQPVVQSFVAHPVELCVQLPLVIWVCITVCEKFSVERYPEKWLNRIANFDPSVKVEDTFPVASAHGVLRGSTHTRARQHSIGVPFLEEWCHYRDFVEVAAPCGVPLVAPVRKVSYI